MSTDDKFEQVRVMTMDAMDKSFVMGMNYQRLITLEKVNELAILTGFDDSQIHIISRTLGLLTEATDADIPTSSNHGL